MGQITTIYRGDMLFESKLGNHNVLVDVPASMGGSDRAPTPPEFFIASLGSCVAAFVADNCRRSGLDVAGLSVDVTFDKVENPTRLANIKVTVRLPQADCGKRRQSLLKVAEHCPVHETIRAFGGIEIDIQDRTDRTYPVTADVPTSSGTP